MRYGRPPRANRVYDVPCVEEITGWRREHALASMRACLGVLSFAAFGVRLGQQYRSATATAPEELEAEYERAKRWGDHVISQVGELSFGLRRDSGKPPARYMPPEAVQQA